MSTLIKLVKNDESPKELRKRKIKPFTPPLNKLKTKCIMCRCNIKFLMDGKGRATHIWRSGQRELCRDPKSRKNFEKPKRKRK